MKKLLLSLFALTFLFTVAASAQDQPAQEEIQPTEEMTQPIDEAQPTDEVQPADEIVEQDDVVEEPTTAMGNQQEVQFDQLPDAVKSAFEGSDYAMWQVQTVYEMAPEEGTDETKYEIVVTDGSTEETVTYNQDGEQL